MIKNPVLLLFCMFCSGKNWPGLWHLFLSLESRQLEDSAACVRFFGGPHFSATFLYWLA
jgi:hypothetical protein